MAVVSVLRFPHFKASAHVIEEVSICSAILGMRLVKRPIFLGKVSIKFILMLKVIHNCAMNLRQRERWEVGLYLLRRLTASTRGDDIAQQHTAFANEQVALEGAYEQIGVHLSSPRRRD
jgi:hypothetical protein